MTRLVLASGSPRRRDILAGLGLAFDVRPPKVDESLRSGEDGSSAALRLAEEKAVAVPTTRGELVVAADTIVVLDGELLGKPVDPAAARQMLRRLSGRSHTVITGIAVGTAARLVSRTAETEVHFRHVDDEEIEAYVATGEPLDKAGSYGIQGFGSALVERIEGDFFNVMGLPVPAFLELLGEAGYRYLFGELVALDVAAGSDRIGGLA